MKTTGNERGLVCIFFDRVKKHVKTYLSVLVYSCSSSSSSSSSSSPLSLAPLSADAPAAALRGFVLPAEAFESPTIVLAVRVELDDVVVRLLPSSSSPFSASSSSSKSSSDPSSSSNSPSRSPAATWKTSGNLRAWIVLRSCAPSTHIIIIVVVLFVGVRMFVAILMFQ